MEKQFLSIKETAPKIGIHYSQLYRLVQKKDQNIPPYIRVGDAIRFRKEDVENFVNTPVNRDKKVNREEE